VAYGVGLWKNIKRGWRKFSSHIRFEVGEGFNVRFWYDLWCGDMTLKDAFLVLYDIVCTKDAFVATHLELTGRSNQWNRSFVRAAHDWKVDVFASFFKVLYSVKVRRVDVVDKLWWVPSKSGLFDVRYFYGGFLFP
jgi:hypothetical protein